MGMHDPEIDGLTPKVEIGVLMKIYVKRRTDEMTMTQDRCGRLDVLVCSSFGLDEGKLLCCHSDTPHPTRFEHISAY